MPSPTSAGSNAQRPADHLNPPVVQPGFGNNIIVHPSQRLNPVLDCIKNVGKEFGQISADYQVGRTTGVLFLSLRYHRVHPEYIYSRIEGLGHAYNLRILLILCDVSQHQDIIRELTKTCLINNITIMVAWNAEEAGYYLSTFKQFEHKSPDLIKERVDKDYYSMLRTTLTSISKVNKTDVETLRTSFGSVADIARATSEQLQNLPGFGQVKARRVKEAFEKPFHNASMTTLPSQFQQYSQTNTAEKPNETRSTAASPTPEPGPSTVAGRPREPSPVWDIELDLDDMSPIAAAESGPPPSSSSVPQAPSSSNIRPARAPHLPSPVWDIELDLNDSDKE